MSRRTLMCVKSFLESQRNLRSLTRSCIVPCTRISLQRCLFSSEAGISESKPSAPSPPLTSTIKETNLVQEQQSYQDRLIQQLVVECQGNEKAVLKSYSEFIKMTCSHLALDLQPIEYVPPVYQRLTLLKSAFVHKKHRVQYEMRTHFLKFTVKHLTGSTADTFLEYIQRMCPENVAMKVTEYELTQFPDPLQKMLERAKQDHEEKS